MLHQSHSSNSRDNGNDQDMIRDQLESMLTTAIRLHYQQEALSSILSAGQWAYTEYSSFSGHPKGE